MAWLVTDLPEPDSPTMPMVLPRSSRKLSPSTDLTSPSSVGKCTLRSRTSRYAVPVFSSVAPGARVEVEGVAGSLVMVQSLR